MINRAYKKELAKLENCEKKNPKFYSTEISIQEDYIDSKQAREDKMLQQPVQDHKIGLIKSNNCKQKM